jgi:membrane-associated phospholipid phosphatase
MERAPNLGADDAVATGASLEQVGGRRQLRIGGIRISGKRRRPAGEKAPLPREFRASAKFWLIAGLGTAVVWITLFYLPAAPEWWTRRDLAVLNTLVDLRTDPMTTVMKAIDWLTNDPVVRAARWGTFIVLIVYRRWRHLIAGIAAIALVEGIAWGMTLAIGRPRPLVDILVPWEGYSHPSTAMAGFAVTLGVVGYSLFPRGRGRNWYFVGASVAIAVVGFARLYLGVDHPSDVLVGATIGISVVVVIYKLFVPDAVFPVSYHRGKAAHLDVTGERGQAIKSAVHDQLGLEVLELGHVGLAGSGGSTPLRMKVCQVDDESECTILFAKLYAQGHLRADRWYKWGRTILYGSLEDEVRFGSVRRLVEYEDYLMRVMADADVPSARSFGFLEITPEREYLIVTEFLDGATEISDVEIADTIIDNALLIVRRLWDGGLAHRDIKPANLMVRDHDVVLIDVAFGQIRPSPWRQAVDLANMMIVLALGSDPQRVYDRALRFFSPDDIAEAFAATHSVTVPSQSRSMLKEHKKKTFDVVEAFRELAPHREPISIQRWNTKRIAMAAVTILGALMLVSLIIDNLRGQGFL